MSDRACKTCRFGIPYQIPTLCRPVSSPLEHPEGAGKIKCKHGPYQPVKDPDDWCHCWKCKLIREEKDDRVETDSETKEY